MATFTLSAFRQAFEGVLRLEDKETCGGHLRSLGGAKGVGIDLLRASYNADCVHSAAMQVAYAEGDDDFDQFSRTCITLFLSVVLGGKERVEEWTQTAFRQLKVEGVSSCTTSHQGFSLRLLQLKPYQMFLLTATDDVADGK